MPDCLQCQNTFEITPEDRVFLKLYDAPEPRCCPACRRLQRMLWRNEKTLYQSFCAWCKKAMVSCFSPNSPFTVLCADCWWGPKFDPLKYGRDFDFNRSFFDQFWEHLIAVPVGNLFIASSENSEYSNFAVGNKDCFMTTASDFNQDCFYIDNSNNNRDSAEASFINNCELSYDCVNTVGSYSCIGCDNVKNSNFCFFSSDLIGCSNCIGCVGLRNASSHVFNQPMSKDQYEAVVKKAALNTFHGYERLRKEAEQWILQQHHEAPTNINVENCTGAYIVNSKNCSECFNTVDSEDCRYSDLLHEAKSCMDVYGGTKAELYYQTVGSTGCYKPFCCAITWPGSSETYYCFLSRTAKNCFGCMSLQKNQYCILNKQYSKTDYEKFLEKIKAHMLASGEWGEFFPMKISPWSYNETIANDHFPRSKEEVLQLGARWEDNAPGTYGKETMTADQIPDAIQDVPDLISKEILLCTCGRNYKIISQELSLYKRLLVPLPRTCPQCRLNSRINRKSS